MALKKVSIVIPTYNEEKTISACLDSLLKQSYKDFEIIVVDDGSKDKTLSIIKSVAKTSKRVRFIKGAHKGPGFSRNLGAKHAKGEILVFVDADMTFDKDYVKHLIHPIVKGEVIGTEDGKQIASNPENIWSRCWGTYFKDYINPDEGQIFRAILKKEFRKMKGFDPSFGYADDLTFYYKFGATSQRVPKAICYHKNPSTLKEVYKQSRWIGASIRKKPLQYPEIKHLIPILLYILSPLMIPILSIRKSIKNKEIGILIPWMIIFISVRYFGTTNGIFRKIYLNKNVR